MIAVVSLLALVWWSSSNIDDPSLSKKNDSASTKSKNVKSVNTPEVFYSPPPKAKPADTPDTKEPLVENQTEPWDETAIESMREARLQGDDRTPPITRNNVPAEAPTPEELADPELYSEYETRQEMKLKSAYVAAAYPEMQTITKQLQAMRDAGLDEAAVREAEEKLIQLQQMTQRLQEQHPELTPKEKDDSAASP